MHTSRRKLLALAGASLTALALLAGCTPGTDTGTDTGTGGGTAEENEATGDTITIGFSGPAADHGWLGAINSAAIAEAAKYEDIELIVAEGTNEPTCRSARSRPSSTTASMPSCCCPPMVRR